MQFVKIIVKIIAIRLDLGAECIFMSTSTSTLVMDEYKYEYIGDG